MKTSPALRLSCCVLRCFYNMFLVSFHQNTVAWLNRTSKNIRQKFSLLNRHYINALSNLRGLKTKITQAMKLYISRGKKTCYFYFFSFLMLHCVVAQKNNVIVLHEFVFLISFSLTLLNYTIQFDFTKVNFCMQKFLLFFFFFLEILFTHWFKILRTNHKVLEGTLVCTHLGLLRQSGNQKSCPEPEDTIIPDTSENDNTVFQ